MLYYRRDETSTEACELEQQAAIEARNRIAKKREEEEELQKEYAIAKQDYEDQARKSVARKEVLESLQNLITQDRHRIETRKVGKLDTAVHVNFPITQKRTEPWFNTNNLTRSIFVHYTLQKRLFKLRSAFGRESVLCLMSSKRFKLL